MHVYFEELSPQKRAGGIETACSQLVEHMQLRQVAITRSADKSWDNSSGLPDCVHIQGIWSPSLAKKFWRWKKLNVPCVISPHGMLEAWALSHKFLRKRIAWWLYQKTILNRSDAIHATSEPEAAQLARLGLTAKIAVIPWGVNTSTATPSTPRLKNTQAIRTALFAGRLCPVKGLPMLFQAWKAIQPPGWNLSIIGPDENGYRKSLESMVDALGIQSHVNFAGGLSKAELEKACLQAELFILPSHSENFGMVVGEALALGVPVITTRATPWKRIADTGCGWWVPPTVEDLTAALRDATSKSAMDLQQMGAIGSELIRREYTWERSVQKFYELYAGLSDQLRHRV